MTDWPGQEEVQWPGQEVTRRTVPDQAARAAIARGITARMIARGAVPGIGALVQPLGDLLANPDQRAALGNSMQGALRTAAQIPSLNAGQLFNDTIAAGQRAIADLPNVPGRVLSNLPAIARGLTYGPFEDEERAQQALDLARAQHNPQAAQAAAQQANAATGGALTNTAGALLGPLARTPLQGAALAAGLTAPNSLANGQGTLQQRLPQALVDTAGGALIGAGLPLIARNARATPGTPAAGSGSPAGVVSASSPASRLADFETAGVRPTLAATVEGTPGDVTKTISENWLGGITARAGLRQSLADTAQRAHDLAARVGDVQDPELAGEAVQAGVRRFAGHNEMPQPYAGDPRSVSVQDWSFPAKAEALYSRAFDQLEADERAMTGHVDGPVVSVDNTVGTINRLADSVSGHESRDLLGPNAFLRQMRYALSTDNSNGSLSFRDLRSWRTRLREMMNDNALRGDTSSGALKQVYGALTRDITATAQNIGGQAAEDLPAIDRWYRRISGRIETALEPFNKGGGRQAYQRIIALASQGPQQNTAQLRALASSLRPDEMRTVGATLLDEMGAPLAGKPGASEPGAFSVSSFATRWNRLSEGGKAALFPDELRRELDALARVADYQREVEANANFSRSNMRLQNLVTTGGLAAGTMLHNPLATAGTLAAIGGMNLTGHALTNPALVRWLTRAAQARANGPSVGRALAELRRIAARDPAVVPVYNNLVRAQPASAPDQQAQVQLSQ